jgi:hypothetical protein
MNAAYSVEELESGAARRYDAVSPRLDAGHLGSPQDCDNSGAGVTIDDK